MADVTIKIAPNGPLLVSGSIEIFNPDGSAVALPEGRPMVALCRCGASVTKPFCDGTHSKVGFDAAKAAVPGS